MNRKGFTLIEMLIVVAIIGILASVVIVGLGPAQKRGRDARRASDLRGVQTALELIYNKTGAYPTNINSWAALQTALTGGGIGVSQIPNDPSAPTKEYMYASDANGTSYVLGATLDDPTNALLKSSLGTFPQGFTGTSGFTSCDTTKAIYCLSI